MGDTIAEIERHLGEPAAVDTEVVPNRHSPEIEDTIYNLKYDGLETRVYDVTRSGKQILTRLSITDPQYETKWNLGVGASRQRILQVLGEPAARSVDTLAYVGAGPAQDRVVFFLEGDTVRRVEWRFYID